MSRIVDGITGQVITVLSNTEQLFLLIIQLTKVEGVALMMYPVVSFSRTQFATDADVDQGCTFPDFPAGSHLLRPVLLLLVDARISRRTNLVDARRHLGLLVWRSGS